MKKMYGIFFVSNSTYAEKSIFIGVKNKKKEAISLINECLNDDFYKDCCFFINEIYKRDD